MAKLVNKFGLPAPLFRAIQNDGYNKGVADFSMTELLMPPRATALLRSHCDKIEVDVTMRIQSLIGNGAHSIAERSSRPNTDISEKRFFSTFMVNGREYKVSGQIDLYETDTRTLWDWKTTKISSLRRAQTGQSTDWVEQLNGLAELLRRNGHQPTALRNIVLLKDWTEFGAGMNGKPKAPCVSLEFPLWTPRQVSEHIENRIRLHVEARSKLPYCSAKENWGGNRCSWCDAASVCTQFQKNQKLGHLRRVLKAR